MIGARVRQVRELLGRTQTELGEAARIPQPTISGIEAGGPVTEEQIERIALATGFPTGWFYKEMVVDEFPEGTIRFRKKAAATKKQDRRAIRRLELAAEIVHDLGRELRTPPVTLPHLGRPSSPSDIERAAASTRKALELHERGPVRNLVRSVERAGAIVVGLPVEIGTSGPVRNHHGVSAWPHFDDRPVIGFSTLDPGDRQRHTVAHEIGHLVMHDSTHSGKEIESEASEFAAALLMPYDDAVEAFQAVPTITLQYLAHLKKGWGVSIAALIMRAKQVGAISDERVRSLFKQLGARGWRTNEPITVHREEPALVPRLIEKHFGTPPDWRAVGRHLDLPPHLIREVATVGDRDVLAERVAVPIDELAARRRTRRSVADLS